MLHSAGRSQPRKETAGVFFWCQPRPCRTASVSRGIQPSLLARCMHPGCDELRHVEVALRRGSAISFVFWYHTPILEPQCPLVITHAWSSNSHSSMPSDSKAWAALDSVIPPPRSNQKKRVLKFIGPYGHLVPRPSSLFPLPTSYVLLVGISNPDAGRRGRQAGRPGLLSVCRDRLGGRQSGWRGFRGFGFGVLGLGLPGNSQEEQPALGNMQCRTITGVCATGPSSPLHSNADPGRVWDTHYGVDWEQWEPSYV